VPTPTIDPEERDPADVAPTETYAHDGRVWVYRDGVWRAGIVELASPYAATVICRDDDDRIGVDIRTARYLLPRDEHDPVLDADPGGP
jgi:hypothetical protein